MTPHTGSTRSVHHDLASGKYQFVDAGCGSGGSICYCRRRFGKEPGIGIERDPRKIAGARAAGFEVLSCDMLELDLPASCVSFVSMMDFLEHLPDRLAAERVLRTAGRAARDFLFIRHPSFEETDTLARHRLRFAWTSFRWHPNRMRIRDLEEIFRRFGWSDYEIIPRKPITDSAHPEILPQTAPNESIRYDEKHRDVKPFVTFDPPIAGQYDLFVRLNPNLDDDEWDRIRSTSRIPGFPPSPGRPTLLTRILSRMRGPRPL